MKSTLRVLVLVFMVVYIVSPIDGFPGPIDDVIVAVAGVITARKLSARKIRC